jgi:hypothetical protein
MVEHMGKYKRQSVLFFFCSYTFLNGIELSEAKITTLLVYNVYIVKPTYPCIPYLCIQLQVEKNSRQTQVVSVLNIYRHFSLSFQTKQYSITIIYIAFTLCYYY